MKKMILVIITIFSFTSCSFVDDIIGNILTYAIIGTVGAIIEIFSNSPSNKEFDLLTKKGLDELMTEEEKKDKNFKFIVYKSPFNEQPSKTLILNHYDLEKVSNFIKINQDKIIISYNTTVIQQAIEYMGKNQTGRNVLKNCRFIFLNFVSREKISNLSKELNFKYSYPS